MRLAATVMLVREAEPSYEIFMVRRSQASHFAPNAYVFPGGTVSQSDLSERALARTRGVGDAWLQEQFRAQPADSELPRPSMREAAALCFTAIRELFEEAGVLLACGRDGLRAIPSSASARTNFLAMLEARDLYAEARALTLFSHWITPPQFAQRYNTHFFLARAGNQEPAQADDHETHSGVWLSPVDALARYEAGELQLVYATIKHLERLSRFRTSGKLFSFARKKQIVSVSPHPRAESFALPDEIEEAW